MWQKLEEIDWLQFENAYSETSEQFGFLLTKAYQERDDKAFEEVLDWAWNNLIHQGTIYPVTAEALPFLIDLLNFSPPSSLARLLRFIAEVSNSVNEHMQFLEYMDEKPLADLPDGSRFVGSCSNTISHNVGLFQRMFSQEDEQVRITIPFLLNTITTRHAVLRSPMSFRIDPQYIHSLIMGEKSSLAKCSLICLLRSVSQTHQEGVGLLKKMLLTENDKRVQIFLALALGDLKQYKESLAPLVTALHNIEETDRLYENQLLWFHGRLRFQVVYALCKFPREYAQQLVHPFLQVIAVANKHTVEIEIAPILKFVFQDRKISIDSAPIRLTNDERTILQAIFNKGLVETDSGNASLGYKISIGIPDKISTWQKILDDK